MRANENIALTAIQTLFAREHNRIVAALPNSLPPQKKFEIARRVVGAEVQYITYNEFLPALGVKLADVPRLRPEREPGPHRTSSRPSASGRTAWCTASSTSTSTPGDYSAAQLAAFAAEGIEVTERRRPSTRSRSRSPSRSATRICCSRSASAPMLAALGGEHEYKNDEQIDNTMRSVLFEVPKPGTTDPAACQTPVVDPRCFSGVADLGADDIERGRDHGMPSYNAMRRAYGLAPKRSFTAITGESTDRFPSTRRSTRPTINDPNILDFVAAARQRRAT